MDGALVDVILGRIDADSGLSEGASHLLLAACLGDDALANALGGQPPPRPAGPPAVPRGPGRDGDGGDGGGNGSRAGGRDTAGVFLASITVEGFRGVGPARTLELHPGPGLTVVAGRNGSGKSSFAEGLEVLLRGSTARFESYAVFRDGWRNLHRQHPARVRAEFHVDGALGTTVVERTWAANADLADGTTTVRTGDGTATSLAELGWAGQLATYKPFLAHSDLEAMFDGKPSELYDRLAAVLGLDDLTAAQARLAAQRRVLEGAIKTAEAERKAIAADLAVLDDERAARLRAAMTGRDVDLDAVARLVTGADPAAPGGEIDILQRLANLRSPDPAATEAAADRLRRAAAGLAAVAGTEAARAQATADLLRRALALHDQHPDDTDCPVCGRAGALDAGWRRQAEAEVERLEGEAAAAESAHREALEAAREAMALVTPVPAVLAGQPDVGVDPEVLTLTASRWADWAATPRVPADRPGDLRALADHLAAAGGLAAAVDEVRRLAAGQLASREDRWAPAAERAAAWLPQWREATAARPLVEHLKAAERWLKAAHDDIRNERLRPIAERAQATWQALRHESNVELGAIRLAGSSTQRRVELNAVVDGSNGNALGVMSQGEVNALALSVFLPRATLPESPFRFVVIDDPVQAMDPAKVDGLARVLHEAARTHQVVVFTHDDRLPNALRRLDLDARILRVQRRPNSIVELVPSGDPVTRALGDARAVERDTRVPEDVRRRVVPGQCRLALEAALADIVVRRELGAGRPHHEVDEMLAGARSLRQKAKLAAFGDTANDRDPVGWLAGLDGGLAATFKALNAGAHGEFTGRLGGLVNATERLIEGFRAAVAEGAST